MPAATFKSTGQHLERTIQVQEQCPRSLRADALAVDPFERGTGDYQALLLLAVLVQPLANDLEPGPPVVIVERGAGGHFLHVLDGVQAVAVNEFHTQLVGHERSDGRLAGPRNTHDHHERLDIGLRRDVVSISDCKCLWVPLICAHILDSLELAGECQRTGYAVQLVITLTHA